MLRTQAEADVRDTTERFKAALTQAKQDAKNAYIAYQEHLKREEEQRIKDETKEAEFFGGLV
jgi:hypothetical protein